MHQCEIKNHKGIPRLFVDGKLTTPMCYQFMSSDPRIHNNIPLPPFMETDEQLSAMYESGVKMFFVRIEFGDPADFESTFQKLAASIRQLRKIAPDAYALPWLIISPYEDFYRKYPNDVQKFDDSTVGGYNDNAHGRMKTAEAPRHTHASLAWRHDTAGHLRRLVRRIRSEKDLDDAVIGYFFFPLLHEANYFTDYDQSKKLDDYSDATKLAFRNYLAEKYLGDEKLLQKAWRRDNVTFETAEMPGRKERENVEAGLFYDPAVSQQVIDFAEIRSRVWSETLEYFARACKEETQNRALVGSFWGYLMNAKTLWGGQGYFRKLYDSPFLDFWASPFPYVNKNAGMSVTVRGLQRSMQKHGKMFFAEVDTTTCTSHPTQRKRQGMYLDHSSQDIGVVKRDFAYVLTEGLHGWWIDWASGTALYKKDQLQPVVKEIQRIASESAEKPMGSISPIAALVEQNSLFHVHDCNNNLTSCAIQHPRLHELPYLGTPVDYYEMHDALDGSLSHPILMFLNAFCLSDEERADIMKLRKPGRAMIFQYAQGYLSPNDPTAHEDNISSLVGIKVKRGPALTSPKIKLTKEAEAFGMKEGDVVGFFEKLIRGGIPFSRNGEVPYLIKTAVPNPAFIIDDPDATVLGVYEENGLPAFAVKNIEGCDVYYFGSTALPARLLRAICHRMEIPLITHEDCVVYANESYFGIHAPKDGEFTLHVPKMVPFREVFTGERYEPCDTMTVTVKKADTLLFEYLES
ncbi:MAG: hypothetical protein IKJ74_07805 [Clostridia bacterium]|nr:hypothetical protein [Clostridia bacterium]